MSLDRISIAAILESRQPTVGTSKLVGIDGHGGAGKSTLAALLAIQFSAVVIHTDDFASWDNPKNWWPRLIADVLEPLSKGARTVSYERSQWWPDHEPTPVIDAPATQIIILEGVSVLRKEFRPFLAAGVFVWATRDACMRRGVERDATHGTPDEIRAIWEQYYSDEEAYFRRDDPKRYADVVLDGTRPFEIQLDLGNKRSFNETRRWRRESMKRDQISSVPDTVFAMPRLAEIYDVLDGDRADLEFYREIANEFGAFKMLDVGCGTGTFACMLAQQGKDVIAIDPAVASVEVARRKAGADRVNWIVGDMTVLPPIQLEHDHYDGECGSGLSLPTEAGLTHSDLLTLRSCRGSARL